MAPMHGTQRALLELSRKVDLSALRLREMAERIDMPSLSPQLVRHHLRQLIRRGLLSVSGAEWSAASAEPTREVGVVGTSTLFMLPIMGAANCGPAQLFADANLEGFLRVSPKLLSRRSPLGLFALKASGASMNNAEVGGRTIQDGDYVIVDSQRKSPRTNDVVVALIDSRATIKRFINDTANGQVVLRADSSQDFEPIHLHPEDEFQISGTVVAVIKQPRIG